MENKRSTFITSRPEAAQHNGKPFSVVGVTTECDPGKQSTYIIVVDGQPIAAYPEEVQYGLPQFDEAVQDMVDHLRLKGCGPYVQELLYKGSRVTRVIVDQPVTGERHSVEMWPNAKGELACLYVSRDVFDGQLEEYPEEAAKIIAAAKDFFDEPKIRQALGRTA